jgi:hypothetical protein
MTSYFFSAISVKGIIATQTPKTGLLDKTAGP